MLDEMLDSFAPALINKKIISGKIVKMKVSKLFQPGKNSLM